MNTWDLDALYKGCDDSKFLADFKQLETEINQLNHFAASLSKSNETDGLLEAITVLKSFFGITRRLGAYLALRQAVDTTNQEISTWMNKFDNMTSDTAKSFAIINLWLSKIDITKLDQSIPEIKEHLFWIQENIDEGKYILDENTEAAISKMTLNASNTWENMREYLTSTLTIDYNGEVHTLSSIRNLAYSTDAKVRKEAFEAEIKAYDKIKDAVAFALNSIKGQANVMAELRGYDDVLDMTLKASRMENSTLDAMMSAINEVLPTFHRYLKQKAKILGYTNGLPFYDIFANVGHSDSHFTIEQSKDYLIKHFDTFSKEVSDVVRMAYDENWIDFYPRKGKVGGAFCYNLPMIKQSRVLTNFDHTLSDVVTLAHELGHAYHGYCIQDHSILNTHYTMPVAETASTFNETIIMNAAIKDAKNDEEKILLIESSLQDATQVIVDISSRYIFETNVLKARKEAFLFPEQLEEMMKDSQIKAYGDGLDPNLLHPYMWINKSHYYSVSQNLYNFPYAFGLLFAKGLYALYQKEGQKFTTKYHELLRATTISSCEDVAKIADIDLTDINFWRSSLKVVTDSIEEFIRLTSK